MGAIDLQRVVRCILDGTVSSGRETGLQVAVCHDGQLAVDAVAGVADPDTGRPVTADTLFWSASALKGATATLAHVLVERGVLDYDRPIVRWWPEFAVHGKDAVTLRHVLLHQAGVPGLPADLTVEQLCDWDEMCALIADAEPWWRPGTRIGYHAITFGFIVGELVRRATEQPVSAALREVITEPLGIADEVFFGVPNPFLPRVARQMSVPEEQPPGPAPESAQAKAMPVAIEPSAQFANRADVLAADIPSMGTATARGLARLYAALLAGDVLGPDQMRELAAVQVRGFDVVMGFDTELAFGFGPGRPSVSARPNSAFGMPGSNGSYAYADLDSGVAVAITRNRFRPGDLSVPQAIDEAVADAFPTTEVST